MKNFVPKFRWYVLSPSCFHIGQKHLIVLEISRFLNDHIAELILKYPKNYLGLGNHPYAG